MHCTSIFDIKRCFGSSSFFVVEHGIDGDGESLEGCWERKNHKEKK